MIKATTDNFVLILGYDDDVVPFEENKKLFEQYLQPRLVAEHGKGHFSGGYGVMELPAALDALLGMM